MADRPKVSVTQGSDTPPDHPDATRLHSVAAPSHSERHLEPMLPFEGPKPVSHSGWRLSWQKRLRTIFTQPVKIPGWVLVLYGAVQLIPDWKSRFDFWLDVAKESGGYLAVVASVIASPYFTPSLLAAGFAWIIFAGEAPRGVQRHHWLRHVGWAIVAICLTIIVLTAGYGAFTFYVQQLVSEEDRALQQKYASKPVLWHLTEAEKIAFGHALEEVPEDQRFEIKIVCLPDAGSRTFVEDLAIILMDKKWKASANCLFNNLRPDFVGLAVGISPALKNKKLEELPKNIATLAKILNDAKLPGTWAFGKDGDDENTFQLIVGNPP